MSALDLIAAIILTLNGIVGVRVTFTGVGHMSILGLETKSETLSIVHLRDLNRCHLRHIFIYEDFSTLNCTLTLCQCEGLRQWIDRSRNTQKIRHLARQNDGDVPTSRFVEDITECGRHRGKF